MLEFQIQSSYIKHNYGKLIQTIVGVIKPETCVEVGVLDGYSTVLIGLALKTLGGGHLYAYDLFDDYDYNHRKYHEVLSRIERLDLTNEVTLKKLDLIKAEKDFGISSVDFMHVDISNCGNIVRDVLEVWNEKIKPGGILIFEGGSPLRDEISWMKEYNKNKIFRELKRNKILNSQYTFVVFHQFPSMTVCSKNMDFDPKNWIDLGYDETKKGDLSSIIFEKDLTE